MQYLYATQFLEFLNQETKLNLNMLRIFVEAISKRAFKSFSSNYSHYCSYALHLIAQDQMRLQYYQYTKLQCIEICLWLYLKESWCESNIPGHVKIIIFLNNIEIFTYNQIINSLQYYHYIELMHLLFFLMLQNYLYQFTNTSRHVKAISLYLR